MQSCPDKADQKTHLNWRLPVPVIEVERCFESRVQRLLKINQKQSMLLQHCQLIGIRVLALYTVD
ncbi:hypothetical protein D3C72_2221980 [compost metagenome]